MARVTVTANDSWTVSIPSEVTWVHSDKMSGDGNGEINITVDVNPRAAYARVAGDVGVAVRGAGGDHRVLHRPCLGPLLGRDTASGQWPVDRHRPPGPSGIIVMLGTSSRRRDVRMLDSAGW